MSIDKSWIQIRNRLSDEYWNGAKTFVEMAKTCVDSRGMVRCPCKKCVNMLYQHISTLDAHIIDNGFDPTYTNWVFHGEPDQYTTQGRVFRETVGDTSEMADIVHDFIGPNVTVEHADEYGETHTGTAGVGSPEEECVQDDLYKEMETELYPGCTTFSSLNFIVKLMHLKVMHKWTNKSFDSLLKLLKEALPMGNKLPESHYDAKKWLSKLGLGYESIHACKHDCALFRGENANRETCPICGESRWLNKNTKGKKVPQKVLRYFPVTPRLK